MCEAFFKSSVAGLDSLVEVCVVLGIHFYGKFYMAWRRMDYPSNLNERVKQWQTPEQSSWL
jgi:hypothetical protein